MNAEANDNRDIRRAADGEDAPLGNRGPSGSEPADEETHRRVTELTREAYQLLRESYIAKAEALFREVLELEPDNHYALVGLGDAARKREDYESAVDIYKRCLEVTPDNRYALFGLADSYKALRHYNRAVEVWEQYLKHDSENVTVLTRVADAYRNVRGFKRAEELYQRVLEIEADNPYAIIGLGHLNYDFRRYETALSYWKRMYELHGDQVDIRVLTAIGNCYRKLHRFDEALPYFQKALEHESENFYALFGIADCYRGIGRGDLSLPYWNRILKRNPDNKVILTRAGDAFRELGYLDEAELYYKRALSIDFDFYAKLGLALIEMSRENYESATDLLQPTLDSTTPSARAFEAMANCYLELGRPEQALEVLRQYTHRGGKNRSLKDRAQRLEHELARRSE